MKRIFAALLALFCMQATAFADGLYLLPGLLTEEGNVAYSPASLELALFLVSLGADGESRDALEDFLATPVTEDELARRLDALAASGIRAANAAFIRGDEEMVSESYREILSRLGVNVFQNASLSDINSWVEEETDGMIPEFFRELPTFDLLLMNAIAMDAKWMVPFTPGTGYTASFYAQDGETEADYMQKTSVFAHGEAEGVRFARLDYAGDAADWSMYLALPSDMEGALSELSESGLSWFCLDDEDLLRISVPKFDVEASLDLTDILSKFGLSALFVPGSGDFDRIFPGAYVSGVKQSVRIVVDEEGTRAVAATGVMMCGSAAPGNTVDEIVFDRPFIALIGNRTTGEIAFFAIINNPSSGGDQ